MPKHYFIFLRSYLSNIPFLIKHVEQLTTLHAINAGVAQCSVFGPILYLLYTLDLPIMQIEDVILGTLADDTVALAVAFLKLQTYLNSILEWQLNWRIKSNEAKSFGLF